MASRKKASNKDLHLQSLPVALILFVNGLVAITAQQQQIHYEPVDNITIDCGSLGNNTADDRRTWNGDVNSKFFPTEGQNGASVTSKVVGERIEEVSLVPYETARISSSEFTYKIPVTPGPKFIRLYFYSGTYENYDNSKAFFSVEAGKYTLLRNFSVFLTAHALNNLKGIKKEYIVTVEQRSLDIKFIPSSSVPGAFAFVNGIEVVSMPHDLYYPAAGQGNLIELVGQQGQYYLANDAAFETMYRINIGAGSIPALDDTGMFREWDGEDSYLTDSGYSKGPYNHAAVTLEFKDNITTYAAPVRVYNTARSMGNAGNAQVRSYNLTWEFPVDSGFNYMLRLHFCEIEPDISKPGDRVFYVFIANQTVGEMIDVVSMSGGQYVPYFRDYAVLRMTGKRSEKRVNLSVALEANPDNSKTHFVDAILNGLEIFKLSDASNNLAGLNPDPTNTDAPTERNKGKSNQTTIIGVVAALVSGAVVLSVVIVFIIRRGRTKDSGSSDGTTWGGPISFKTTESTKTRRSSTLPSDLCRYFSLAEIKAATSNFEDIFVIGIGGFGNVYKGYIDSGTTPVAIKRLKSESSQGAHEFKTEIEMLSHLRHRHLVSLIGYCDDHGEMILVYEYMARGTLRDHLYKTENPPLPWKQRLEICIGAARGLHYLHKGAKHTIIHRDVKTTNILLDEKWVAKVSDFGLSKMGSTSVSKAHVTTVVKGSIGYLDPEYYRRQQLSEKSDVYSFGVVLCEVLCGRPPIVRNAEKRQVSLAEWVRSCYRGGTLHQIVDPYLTGKIAPECLKKYGDIAVNCMLDNGTERPSMNDVVWGLEFALQLQQSAEDNDRVGGALVSDCGPKGEKEAVALLNNDSNGTFTCSWEDTSDVTGSSGATKISSSGQGSTTNESMKVFSEICDPKGR